MTTPRSLPVPQLLLVLVAVAWSTVSVGCGGDQPRALTGSPSTTTTSVEELVGELHEVAVGADPTSSCGADATALEGGCPEQGDEVLGTLRVGPSVVVVTGSTVVQTCGPNDDSEEIAFDRVDEILEQVIRPETRATIVATADDAPDWVRATSVFVGSCG